MSEAEMIKDEAISDENENESNEVEMSDSEPANPADSAEMLRMLEAILFASAQPISPQAMLERLPEGADLNILLPALKQNYEGRGVELVEMGGQWAFRTAQDVEESLTIQKEVSKKILTFVWKNHRKRILVPRIVSIKTTLKLVAGPNPPVK